jgi:hypothetical protein
MGASGPYTACHQWGAAVLHDLLTSIHPDVVITSDLADLGSVTDHQVGQKAYEDIAAGMASYWTQLEDNGISVVPIEETPTMSFYPPDCVAKYGASSPTLRGTAGQGNTERSADRTGDEADEGQGQAHRHEHVRLRQDRMPVGRRQRPGVLRRPSSDQQLLEHDGAVPRTPAVQQQRGAGQTPVTGQTPANELSTPS